jgi:hypothetical protein
MPKEVPDGNSAGARPYQRSRGGCQKLSVGGQAAGPRTKLRPPAPKRSPAGGASRRARRRGRTCGARGRAAARLGAHTDRRVPSPRRGRRERPSRRVTRVRCQPRAPRPRARRAAAAWRLRGSIAPAPLRCAAWRSGAQPLVAPALAAAALGSGWRGERHARRGDVAPRTMPCRAAGRARMPRRAGGGSDTSFRAWDATHGCPRTPIDATPTTSAAAAARPLRPRPLRPRAAREWQRLKPAVCPAP